MSNSAFSPSVLTVPSGTTGSGQGELNLITNPVAAVNLDGWVGAGRGTSGGPLNPTIDTYFTILNAFGAESSTSGAYNVLSLPTGLQNKKLKVEFYYTSPALDTFNVSVYKGTTRVPLTTDVSGSTALPQNTTGKFVAYFDTDSSGTWTVSITRTAGTGSTALQFTNVVVGPGIQPQGAVVGEWQSYTPTISGLGTGTTSGVVGQYRRVGDSLEAEIKWSTVNTGSGTGTVTISLPTGYTVDTTKAAGSHANGLDSYGTFSFYTGSAFNASATVTNGGSTSNVAILKSSTAGYYQGADFIVSSSASLRFTVPIAQFAGSGTVQLAQNDVEFSSNSNATNAVSDGSSFAYGPAGSLIPNGAVGTAYDRTIRFQTPLQASDVLSVEVDQGMGLWVPVDRRLTAWVRQGSLGYGIYIEATTSTTVTVSFGSGGFRSSSATYAANGEAWSVVSGWKWRVRKSSAGAAVGFGIVRPGVSSGLVSASGLPGNTTGNAIASGYVGEQKLATSTTSVTTGGIGVNSLSITPGLWLVNAITQIQADTAIREVYTVISTTQNTMPAFSTDGAKAYGHYSTSNGIGFVQVQSFYLNVTTTTDYWQNSQATSISGLSATNNRLQAIRIA
jgi:hypothetical protein